MARPVEEIKEIIMTETRKPPLELTNPSAVALFGLFAYIVAYCIWTLEVLMDKHEAFVASEFLKQKAHTLTWYRNKILNFQFGQDLVPETDRYDNTELSPDAIDAKKIVKYCAVTEAQEESRLIAKVATDTGGVLAKLSNTQEAALRAYIGRFKDAGVDITLINNNPDRLILTLRIYFDPLLIDGEGNRLTDGGKPVDEALASFLRSLPFNGEFALAKLVDKLQSTFGVVLPHIDAAYSASVDVNQVGGYTELTNIDIKEVPEAGYYELFAVNITYLPYV